MHFAGIPGRDVAADPFRDGCIQVVYSPQHKDMTERTDMPPLAVGVFMAIFLLVRERLKVSIDVRKLCREPSVE